MSLIAFPGWQTTISKVHFIATCQKGNSLHQRAHGRHLIESFLSDHKYSPTWPKKSKIVQNLHFLFWWETWQLVLGSLNLFPTTICHHFRTKHDLLLKAWLPCDITRVKGISTFRRLSQAIAQPMGGCCHTYWPERWKGRDATISPIIGLQNQYLHWPWGKGVNVLSMGIELVTIGRRAVSLAN